MSDLRETTGITRTPEAETISSLKADLVAERAVSERLREANRELFGAVVRVVDPNVTPIEARLRGYSFRCRSKEEWVPFSDCLLGAAEEIERLRESNKELAAALRMAVGFSVDFRQRHPNDWQEFEDVGRLFAIATTALKATEGRNGAAPTERNDQ